MSDCPTLAATIDRVEVFRNQALVTRRARLDAPPAGRAALCVGGLPIKLLDDSVRVRVLDGRARVADLRVAWELAGRDRALRSASEEEVRRLTRQLEASRLSAARASAALQQLELLKPGRVSGTELPEGLAFKPLAPMPAWLRLAGWVRQESGALRSELLRLGQEERDLAEALEDARDRLARASDTEQAEQGAVRKAVHLSLDGCAAGAPLALELSYLVPGAAWVPEYELRVLEGKNEAELVLRALCAQRTGEDWTGAAFSFSTADLGRSTELPELDSWRIGRAQPRKPSGWRELPDTLGELFAAYRAGLAPLPPPEAIEPPALPPLPRLEVDGAATSGSAPERGGRPRPAPRPSAARRPAPAPEPEPVAEAYAREEFDEECELAVEAEPLAGAVMDEMAPSSAPMPPPAPQMAAAPMRASAKSAMPRDRSKKMARRDEGGAFGGGGAPLEQEVESELTASASALGYARLRLQGPDAARAPGQLLAASLRAELAEQQGDGEVPAALLEEVSRTLDERLAVSWPTHAVQVADSAGHFAARYPMDGRGSLAADGQLQALTLLRRRGEALRLFRVVPRIDPTVYQVALFANPLQMPLLAGPVRVYRGGDFVVTAPLATTAPQKLLSVNLGVEPAIKVARNTHFKEETGGLFGGGTEATHEITIEVRSKLAYRARVEVFERVPVSKVDEIKVEVLRCEPAAEPYDQRDRGRIIDGGRKFTLELEPGEAKTCRLVYRISLPSKRVLVGGNRRD